MEELKLSLDELTGFSEAERQEIKQTTGYESEDSWGGRIWVDQDRAQSIKANEIRKRQIALKIKNKAAEFGCEYISEYDFMQHVIFLSKLSEKEHGAFDKFVEWYKEQCPAMYGVEVKPLMA